MTSRRWTQEFRVKNGPGRFDLMLSHYDRSAERHVEFVFDIPGMGIHVARVKITDSRWADGFSPDTWILGGPVFMRPLEIGEPRKRQQFAFPVVPTLFKVDYNCQSRSGMISFKCD